MFKKIFQYGFIGTFFALLAGPFIFADRSAAGVSTAENRNLAPQTTLLIDGRLNFQFPVQYECWFKDHLGFREALIDMNAWQQYYLFHRFADSSDVKLGRDGDLNYATGKIIQDYQHINLRTEEGVARIGDSYQTISDWAEDQGIQFCVVQCVDKQTICPEQFLEGVCQLGDVSKTDQVMAYMEEYTSVKMLYLKEAMLKAKEEYDVYSHWGDPTHWTPRGAYIGYREIMEFMEKNGGVPVLQEEDYIITVTDQGNTYHKKIHKEDMLEDFSIREPNAVWQEDKTAMGEFAEDMRHSRWINPHIKDGKKLLIMGDSYINSFIIEDLAEGFAETWMIWGDYTEKLPEVVELYHPDIILYECAERVDRSGAICVLADRLGKGSIR